VCVCVCVYVCICVCMCVYVCVCVCVREREREINHYYFLSVLSVSENFVYITLARHVQHLKSEFYMLIKDYYCIV